MNKQTRRSFLTVCSAAGLAATLPSFYIQASDKSGTRLSVLGSGPHTYECVHDWLVPPEGMVWGDTHGLCQDAQGHIYVGHTVHKSSMRGEGSTEFLYHCDINRCKVVKTTLTGEVTWVHGYPREDASYMERPIDFVPTNVAFAPNGDFYVGDGYGSSHMLRFSLAGKFLGEVGKQGHGDGEVDPPHGLWLDPRGDKPLLVVADRGNRRIQSFTLDGAHLRTIKDEAHMRMPCNFHTQGEWMVCPDLDSQVCILDRDFKVIAQLGDGKAENGEVGSRRSQLRPQFTPGNFITPHDAIFLHNGDILVAEWLPIGRITLLRRT